MWEGWDSGFVRTEEFMDVFHEADDDDDGGASHADKEHDLQNVHCEETESHRMIVNRRRVSVSVERQV